MKRLLLSLTVGFFLGSRDLRRANRWTTLLIIAVMTLTFLNLIVVGGILVGLIQGSEDANRDRYTGDIIISNFLTRDYIDRSTMLLQAVASLPGLENYSARYIAGGRIEAHYKERTNPRDKIDSAGGLVAGIDPERERAVTHLDRYLVEGAFLEPNDYDQVLLGSNLLFKYTPIESPGLQTLRDVTIGSRVRLVIGDVRREVTVKGIIQSKAGENDQRIFMVDRQLRGLIGRGDYNVDEISIALVDPNRAAEAKEWLLARGLDRFSVIQTWFEAQPKFLNDIKLTFALLGNVIGTIGLAVASITIFIVIFVNAITRRRYIGIAKGIGVSSLAIEFSYIIQSLFYAVSGVVLGMIIVFAFLKPYIAAHPINFPFSDGILVATFSGTMIRAAILLIATVVAGYIPAKIVIRGNTLDAILGR
ncbi:MAG: FtsX-like permease family protein [Patescibacteria group bacterium]